MSIPCRSLENGINGLEGYGMLSAGVQWVPSPDMINLFGLEARHSLPKNQHDLQLRTCRYKPAPLTNQCTMSGRTSDELGIFVPQVISRKKMHCHCLYFALCFALSVQSSHKCIKKQPSESGVLENTPPDEVIPDVNLNGTLPIEAPYDSEPSPTVPDPTYYIGFWSPRLELG